MIYVITLIFTLIALAFGVSYYMYYRDKKQSRHSSGRGRRPVREVASYELNAWIDDEIAARKLYKTPNMTASDLADELGISEGRLKHTIKKAYDKSVADYMNDRRIQAACRMLREQSDMTLDEISFEAGFASFKIFQTIFLRTMGQSPEQYRKMVSKQQ